jgi:alpha-tubulin suppressor-like RCC1 family protein
MRFVRLALPVLLIAVAAVIVVRTVTHGSTNQVKGALAIEYWGGTSTKEKHLTPTWLRLPAPVAEVGSSNSTDYALLTNGAVYAWGLGTDGQLGNGSTKSSFDTPVRVHLPAGVKIAFIPSDVMPYNSAFAVDTSGHVWAWGADKAGEFCLHNRKQYNTPVELPFDHVSTLAGAAGHATYDVDGTLYSCGVNQYGELGTGTTHATQSPVKVKGLDGQKVRLLVASWQNTGALLANGAYYDWGYNAAGQLGDGTIGKLSDRPVLVTLPDAVAQVALGGSKPSNGQTLVLLSDGFVYAWGSDAYYQLGDGKTGSEDRPEQIRPPVGVSYRLLASGGNTSYAISTTGSVYAWGSNSGVGAVGNGSAASASDGTAAAKQAVKVEYKSRAKMISSTAGLVVVSVG